jgi:hypothetical protein
MGLVLSVVIVATAFASERNISVPNVKRANGVEPQQRLPGVGLDEIIYFEDWESGDFAGWTPVDLTATPSTWHRDDYNAFGGTGLSWWVGDSTVGPNGGYLDHWYMVLDSPPITLGATSTLQYYQRRSSEPPTPPLEPGYDGWDGENLRISVDNGATWTVIPANVIVPTYTAASLYSFGVEHGEGPNIPGWDSTNATWTQVRVNLTQWANQTVKIRWAFASDPAYSTPQNPSMFGWMVDAFRVYNGANDTIFTSDANADDGFTHQSLVGAAGNLWRVATDNTSPNGPHVIVCNNSNNNHYNPGMITEFISPYVDCSDLQNGILMVDFQLTGSLPTCDLFPDCDYWGFQVSTDSGQSWCYGSNPNCDPAPPAFNYVYVDAPAEWASFNASYSIPLDFSSLIGNVLLFKFTFETNDDANVDVGPKFDGFQVDYQAGFPNDLSCYSLQVRYPNNASHPTRIRAYFGNVGQNDENAVPAWFKIVGNAQQRFLPNLNLVAGATATRDTFITFTSQGTYTVQAWSALSTDEFLDNDTSTVSNVVVNPNNSMLELGYDNRSINFRFNFQTGQGSLAHFTPVADGVDTPPFSVTQIKAQFDLGQPGDLPFQLHVYTGGNSAPGTEVVDRVETVLASETGPDVWKTIDVTNVPALQNISQDFWVWFETTNTDPTDRFPEVLGDDEQPWTDQHFYTWGGSGTPTESAFFYQMHAVIDAGSAAGDQPTELPATWSLAQNYPNPFNPNTEISYSVPRAERMTLKVFNVMGQEVASLVNGMVEAGVHTAVFDASKLPSGVYIYRLESASFSSAHKMLLLK